MDAQATTPLVSVVMAMFDAAVFLDTSVPSILRQSFTDFELILVDDGSTDTTPERIRAYAAADPRVTIVSQPNRGVAVALNHGCSLARGRYIARMDADDIALPHRLVRQIAFLETHPDIDIIGSAVTLIDASGAMIGRRRYPTRPDHIARSIRAGTNAVAHPSVMMRREAFLASGGYNPRFDGSEDYELWLRMLSKHRFANLRETLLLYRVHTASASESGRLQQALSRLVALAAHHNPMSAATAGVPIRWAHLDRLGLRDRDQAALAIAVASVAMRRSGQAEWQDDQALMAAAAALGIASDTCRPRIIAEFALERVATTRVRDVGAAELMASLSRAFVRGGRPRRAAHWLGRAVATDPMYGLGLAAPAARFIGRQVGRSFRHRPAHMDGSADG